MEILVSLIILSLVIVGLVGVFVSGKRYIHKSRTRISGGELGKYFLDPFQNYVNQSTWNTNPLNTKKANPKKITIDGRDYEGNYSIDSAGLPANLTRVKVTITLPTTE